MARYKLTIAKIEPNPSFDEEKASRAQEFFNNRDSYHVSPEIESRQVEVVLTEEEFTAIKRSVMEVWK